MLKKHGTFWQNGYSAIKTLKGYKKKNFFRSMKSRFLFLLKIIQKFLCECLPLLLSHTSAVSRRQLVAGTNLIRPSTTWSTGMADVITASTMSAVTRQTCSIVQYCLTAYGTSKSNPATVVANESLTYFYTKQMAWLALAGSTSSHCNSSSHSKSGNRLRLGSHPRHQKSRHYLRWLG